MQIRPANLNDADAISALIKSVAHCFTLQPQGQGGEVDQQLTGLAGKLENSRSIKS
jgi:hypothetical protein